MDVLGENHPGRNDGKRHMWRSLAWMDQDMGKALDGPKQFRAIPLEGPPVLSQLAVELHAFWPDVGSHNPQKLWEVCRHVTRIARICDITIRCHAYPGRDIAVG